MPWPRPGAADWQAAVRPIQEWPVYSKFFDNMGPIPHHMHQSFEHARLTGQEGKPESYYFPPQYNNVDNNFAYTFMGLEPGTTKADVRRCLERLGQGGQWHSRSVAGVSAQRGTGWLIRPACCTLRLALHLRTAMGKRRVRHVPVAGRRARSPLVAAGEGRALRKAPRSGFHHRTARLGKERRYAFQGTQLLEPIIDPALRPGLHRPLDRLWHDRRQAAL